jgi:hypothetical protein
MATGDQYRIKAAAKAYLRLAEQADRNALVDLVYEPPPPKLGQSDLTK